MHSPWFSCCFCSVCCSHSAVFEITGERKREIRLMLPCIYHWRVQIKMLTHTIRKENRKQRTYCTELRSISIRWTYPSMKTEKVTLDLSRAAVFLCIVASFYMRCYVCYFHDCYYSDISLLSFALHLLWLFTLNLLVVYFDNCSDYTRIT